MAPTLIPPPPDSQKKAPIENVLQLTSLAAIGPDLFTNTRPLWRPPGARGIFGGAAIAQSLAAAQLTVPRPSAENGHAKFYVHSMHCYFVLAGDADIPLIYAVERVRDGRSFLTRTVQVRQKGRCIFTTTLSFVREGSGGAQTIDHAAELPPNAREELRRILDATTEFSEQEKQMRAREGDDMLGPFDIRRVPISNGESTADASEGASDDEEIASDVEAEDARWKELEHEEEEDERIWGEHGMRFPASPNSTAVGPWSVEPEGDFLMDAKHLEFIWRRNVVRRANAVDSRADSLRPENKRAHAWLRARGQISPNAGHEPHLNALAYMSDSWFIGTVARVNNLWRFSSPEKKAKTIEKGAQPDLKDPAELEDLDNARAPRNRPPQKIGMTVSLDHSIYFHRPMDIRADEWMFQEMESPWSGDGRGLAIQRIWNRDGVLLATCVQEGVVRLRQDKKKTDDGAPKGKL